MTETRCGLEPYFYLLSWVSSFLDFSGLFHSWIMKRIIVWCHWSCLPMNCIWISLNYLSITSGTYHPAPHRGPIAALWLVPICGCANGLKGAINLLKAAESKVIFTDVWIKTNLFQVDTWIKIVISKLGRWINLNFCWCGSSGFLTWHQLIYIQSK